MTIYKKTSKVSKLHKKLSKHNTKTKFFSQVGQDEWVDNTLRHKRNGFFIELGAANGLLLSNTLFFERNRNWNGICIEPNPANARSLLKNRNCLISDYCISDVDNEEVDFALNGLYSGLIATAGEQTKMNNIIKVKTKTLETLFKMYKAPKRIDYLSLDVEGHEYNILHKFPFHKYIFNCITVEHAANINGPEMQNKIRKLLEKNSYIFVKGSDDPDPGHFGIIDDYYVHSSIKIPK